MTVQPCGNFSLDNEQPYNSCDKKEYSLDKELWLFLLKSYDWSLSCQKVVTHRSICCPLITFVIHLMHLVEKQTKFSKFLVVFSKTPIWFWEPLSLIFIASYCLANLAPSRFHSGFHQFLTATGAVAPGWYISIIEHTFILTWNFKY